MVSESFITITHESTSRPRHEITIKSAKAKGKKHGSKSKGKHHALQDRLHLEYNANTHLLHVNVS